MFCDTNDAQIIRSQNLYSAEAQISLRKKRVGPNSQFVQQKNKCYLGKRRKLDLVDRISALPDEILIGMLSLLPLKEALATGMLSRRWRRLAASTVTLDFDAINFKVGDHFSRFLKLETGVKEHQRGLYVNWVNRTLERHIGESIERFRVYFFLNHRFSFAIEKWMQFAMEKKVQILELELLYDLEYPSNPHCRFPDKLLDMSISKGPSAVEEFMRSCWENMCCGIPNLHSCGFRNGFKSLKVLRLIRFVVTDEVLETLLYKCSVLERLSLTRAKGLVNLRVVGRLITLKHLVVKDCYDIKMIEICDTNIVSFVYDSDNMPNLLLNNVPFLVEVSIFKEGFFSDSIRLPLNQLSYSLSQLETLELDIRGAVYDQNNVFPVLQNLKHLKLVVANDDGALHHLTSFMKASPCLQTLGLMMAIRKCSEIGKTEKLIDYLHHSLKAVEIQGYRAHPCADEHVIYLLKNAVALDKIVIDPIQKWLWPCGSLRPLEQVMEEIEGRDHAVQHLKEKVPSNVEFVIVW